MELDRCRYGRRRRGGANNILDRVPQGGDEGVLVEGYLGRARTQTAMRVHFWRRHVRDVVIIL